MYEGNATKDEATLADEKKRDHKHDEPSQEYQNFQRLLEDALAVPKEELDKKEANRVQGGRGTPEIGRRLKSPLYTHHGENSPA
jgi:hypothetical protein